MMKYHSKNIYAFLGLIGASLLVSCGETTNLKDPTNSEITTQCSSLGGVCIKGRFIDDAVFNLDYECDKVVATTGADGSFSCPINSKVTFLIKNPADTSASPKKITLGEGITVTNPANLGDSLSVFFYVTPASLSSDPVARQNIVRLLQALSDDPTSADLTGHIIYISDETKKKLTNLGQEIKPADFSKPISIATPATPTSPAAPSDPGSFDALLEPLLGAFSPVKSPMIPAAKADGYLQRGIYSTVAGVYTDFGLLSVANLPFSVPVMTGFNASNGMVASLWTMVDRKGRVMGAGVYSYEPRTSGQQFIYTNSKPMELTSFGIAGPAGVPMWRNSGNLQGMTFGMLDAGNAASSMSLDITQGLMEREAIAGNATLYSNLFDVSLTSVPNDKLGRWDVNDTANPANNIAATNTLFTLIRSRPAAPSLDPDLWLPVVFPLHVALTFWNSDANTPPAAGCDAYGCPIGPPIRISILQDGNIISDLKGDCSDVDPVTLKHVSGDQELPLGLVQNIYKSGPSDTPSSATFMTLALMLPNKSLVASSTPGDDQEKYLRYAQLLTNIGGTTVMRVDGSVAVNPDYLKLHSISGATTNGVSVSIYDSTKASWSNSWTLLKSIDSLNNDPSGSVTGSHIPSAQTLLYQKNRGGYVRSAPVSCP